MAVTAGRRRGPDIVVPVVEADSRYRVRVRRRWHARTSGVGLNSFVREWSATKWEGRHGLMQETVRSPRFTLIFYLLLAFLFRFTDGSSRIERSRSCYDRSEF